MGERGQIGGPNGSEWESAPPAIAGANGEKARGRDIPVVYDAMHGPFCAIRGPCSAMRLSICERNYALSS